MLNTYHQLEAAIAAGFDRHRAIAISYSSPDPLNSRDIGVKKWSVWSPVFKVAPDAAWYDNGSKVFLLMNGGKTHKERKDKALSEAVAWASEKFGITRWVKNSAGDYVEKEINDNFPVDKRERRR